MSLCVCANMYIPVGLMYTTFTKKFLFIAVR